MTSTQPVLVTGGAGFVGRAVALRLVASGRRAILLDVREPQGPLPGGCEVVVADVRDPAAVGAQVARAASVVHLAAVVGIDRYLDDPGLVVDVNVNGTRHVLDACARHARPVVVASTSEVYGMNPGLLREDAPCVVGNPSTRRWSYAISKAAAEHLAFAAARRGVRGAIVRYFNVYGPLMDRPGEGRVVSKFLGHLLGGRPLPLVDGGEAIRSFCYVDDAAAATVALLDALADGGHVAGRAFNVGRTDPVTIRELAEEMVRLAGHGPGVVPVAAREAFGDGFEEIPRRVPDVTALREAIGFEARVDLTTGLARTLAHWGLLRDGGAPRPRARLRFVRPQLEADAALMGALQGALASGQVTNGGPRVQRFEREVAAFLGVARAVAVASGSAALQLVARALPRRGKVILPSFTFIATLSAFESEGYEPVLCDVDPATYTLDPGHLGRLLADTDGVAAVVAVNAYGVTPPMGELRRLSDRAGAALVLDAAHGFGAEHRGRRAPPEAHAVTYSLHATKLLPAVEGGLVVSGDGALLEEIARLRAHGLAPDPLASTPGLNARLDELRAAIASHGLATVEEAIARRRGYVARIHATLAARAPGRWSPQRIPEDVVTNHQNLALRAEWGDVPLDAVIASLDRRGVEARRYFGPPLHRLRRFEGRFTLPATDSVWDRLVCVPIYSRMSDAELVQLEDALVHAATEGSA